MKTIPGPACLPASPPDQFKPYQFRPGTCHALGAHAASWPGSVSLGWYILALVFAWVILCGLIDWFSGQYEVTRCRGKFFRISRRWYGKGAVLLGRGAPDGNRFRVLGWDDEDTPIPWVRAVLCAGTFWSESAGDEPQPFWRPVTDFAPHSVRKLHPRLFRFGWLRIPRLFADRPIRQAAGYLGGDS